MVLRCSIGNYQTGLTFSLALLICASTLAAQSAPVAAPAEAATTISLDEAIRRAEANEPAFAAATADSRVSQLDRSIARAGLLPSATYHNEYLFTQGNGSNDRIGQTATA